MAELNVPISEPYQTKKRLDIDDVRSKKWPGMRFATASLFPVSKNDMIPQYLMSMANNPDLVVLIKGSDKGASEFIDPTRVLMGEPMSGWIAKQEEWVSDHEAMTRDPNAPTAKMAMSVKHGEAVDPDDYAKSLGRKEGVRQDEIE